MMLHIITIDLSCGIAAPHLPASVLAGTELSRVAV